MNHMEFREYYDDPEKELAQKIEHFAENCAVVPGIDPRNGDPLMDGTYQVPPARDMPPAELLTRCRYDQYSSSSRPSGCEIAAVDPALHGSDAVLLAVTVGRQGDVRIDGEEYSDAGRQKVEEFFELVQERGLMPDPATRTALAERERLRGEVIGILEPIHPDQYLPDSGQNP